MYAHVGLYDQTAALDARPGPTAAGPKAEAMAATGTDPVSAFRRILAAQGTERGVNCRLRAELTTCPRAAK
jgi:hypothetical protein